MTVALALFFFSLRCIAINQMVYCWLLMSRSANKWGVKKTNRECIGKMDIATVQNNSLLYSACLCPCALQHRVVQTWTVVANGQSIKMLNQHLILNRCFARSLCTFSFLSHFPHSVNRRSNTHTHNHTNYVSTWLFSIMNHDTCAFWMLLHFRFARARTHVRKPSD